MLVNGRSILGFSEERSNRIVDLAECPVTHPRLVELLPALRGQLPVLAGRGRPVDVKLALTDQGVDVLIERARAPGRKGEQQLTAFAAGQGLARLSVDSGDGVETLWAPEPVTVSLSGVAVPYPPHGFLQPTADGEAALVAAVREIVGEAKAVADLFAGLGTFTFAHGGGAGSYAAEGGRDVTAALREAANRIGKPVRAEHRDLYRRPLMADELRAFDAVILDPPRAGAKEQVAQLASSTVPRIAYVSCNPSSFSRDARILVDGGYQLERVWPVGQFRWSTHVEMVGEFLRH